MKKTASIFGTLLFITACGLLAGCNNSNSGTIEAVSSDQAQKLNAERSKFADIKDQPFNAQTRFAAGQLAEAHGDSSAAVNQYLMVLKLEPNHLGALYRLGILYTQYQHYSEATIIWNQYIKATGASAGAYSNLAYTQELAGQTAAAEKTYQQGITRDPANRPCRINYGLLLARRGQIEPAIAQWKFVLKDVEIHYNLASVYEQLGKKAEAKAEYQKALQLDPKFQDAKVRMAGLTD